MNITTGTRLGPYEIGARIGAGGMGEVWKARDTRLDRSVAIKIVAPEMASRFEREAKTISQLNHPHICSLFDVGENYLVMELLEGESLADRLGKGPMPISDVTRYGVQIAEALDRAHRAGITHRDLKPANVMITKSGAKLLDFGLAKVNEPAIVLDGATQQKPLTQEGTILGTFQYMAPEQLEGVDADTRTDIFALGAVLYEMATGKRAFDGSTKTSLIAAIVSQDPKPMAQVQPLTPPALEHVIAKCLAKSPDDRWQSAHDIAEELRWISEAGSQAGVAAPTVARKKARERIAWGLAAVFAIGAAVFAYAYLGASRNASRVLVTNLAPPPGARLNAIGDDSGAAVVSPDGSAVVFSATTGTKSQLWLRSMATGEVKPIGGTDGAMFPFWSPDSRGIGFLTNDRLKTVDLASGTPVTICQVAFSRGAAWSSDGWIVFTPDTQSPLMRVRATGGNREPVTKLDTTKHTSHRWPSFLPDGKHILYLAANHQDPEGESNGIYLTSIDGGEPRFVMRAVSNAIMADGRLLFMRDRTLFAQKMSGSGVLEGDVIPIATDVLLDRGIWRGAFSVSRDGLLVYHSGLASAVTSSLRWLDRAGKELSRLGDPDAYWDVMLSPDGKMAGLPIGDPLRELWIIDLQRNTRTRLPMDQSWAGASVFSPDGTTLYSGVIRNGRDLIVARRITGGGERVLLTVKNLFNVTSISPDGKELLAEGQDGHIYRTPIAPPAEPTPIVPVKGTQLGPMFSPDGKWIAYASDQNGRFEVFVIAASDATQKWQVSTAGGTLPRWRRDGKELFYVDLSNRMTAVPIEMKGSDLVFGAPQPLFTFTPRPQTNPYDVSADGQRFLVNVMSDVESSPVVVVSDWKSRLRKP